MLEGNKRLILKEGSYFVCAYLSDLMKNAQKLESLNSNYQALEIRLDKEGDSLEVLMTRISEIK